MIEMNQVQAKAKEVMLDAPATIDDELFKNCPNCFCVKETFVFYQ